MIAQFTNNLPYKLAEQLENEFNNRLSDIRYLTSGKFDYYSSLREDLDTISLLLAMSIFYKRIISNFDSAAKFTNRILNNSEATAIQVGTYSLTKVESNRITRVILKYQALMEHYSINAQLFDYLETKEFLRKIKLYKQSLNEGNG